MGSGIAIPKDAIYNSPTYIHSHESTLSYVKNNLDSKATNVVPAVKAAGVRLLNQAEVILKKYYDNEELKQFYNDSHDGSTRKISETDALILKQMEEIRGMIDKFKKDESKEYKKFFQQLIGNKGENGNKSLTEVIGEQYSKELMKLIIENIQSQKVRKTKSGSPSKIEVLQTKIKNGEELLIKDLISPRGSTIKAISTAFQHVMHKEVAPNTSELVRQTMEKLDKDIDEYIKASSTLSGLSYVPSEELIQTIKKRNQYGRHDLIASNMGFMFEKLYPALIQTAMKEGEIVINGNPITVEHEGRSGHEVTTDIVLKFTNDVMIGVSNKLNYFKEKQQLGTSFQKTQSLTNEQHMNVFGQKGNEEFKYLLYFLGNAKAYSVFAAPTDLFKDKRKKVIVKVPGKKDEFEVRNVDNVKTGSMQLEWYHKLKKEYAAIGLIKAMLGYVFLIDNSDTIEQQLQSSTPPVWLAFGKEDYWTYEIVKRLKEEFLNNFDSFQKFIKIKNPNSINSSSMFENFNEDALRELFIIKKLTEKTEGNRIKQILNNSIDPKYSKWNTYGTLENKLNYITKNLTVNNLIDEIIKNVSYDINIANLIGGQ